MRIAVLGGGAVGSLFAARLTDHARVTLLRRQAPSQGVLELRVRRQQAAEERRTVPVLATRDFLSPPPLCTREHAARSREEDERDAIEAVLVTTKAFSAREAVREMGLDGGGGPHQPLVCVLCNGIGSAEEVREVYDGPVVEGSATHGAILQEDGCTVVYAGTGDITLGMPNSRGTAGAHPESARYVDPARLERFVGILNQAQLGARIVSAAEMQRVLWQKLLVNVSVNSITALVRAPNECAFASAHAVEIVDAVVHEGCQVMLHELQSTGDGIGDGDGYELHELVSSTRNRVLEIARKSATNRSSLLYDVEHRRPRLEIDYITGYCVAAARRHGVQTPHIDTLHNLVKTLEAYYLL